MLIIYAHPNRNGHCGQILKTTITALDKKQLSYEVLDLYAEKFNPVLEQEELYTIGNKTKKEDVKTYQNLLQKHNEYIIIYPTWWNSSPAILKGFFDRVLTAGFAFRYVNGMPLGLLKHKKALVITTTGATNFIARTILFSKSLTTVTHNTLLFCGIRPKGMIIGSAQILDDRKREKIEQKISKKIHAFTQRIEQNNNSIIQPVSTTKTT